MEIIKVKTRAIILFIPFILVANSLSSQSQEIYRDQLLSSSFKIYKSADIELAYHIFPFLKQRMVEHLKDSSSFYYSQDSLSKHVSIYYSEDSILKIYCWDERNAGCCHLTVCHGQFKTSSGEIKTIDLKGLIHEHLEVYITDLQQIKISGKPYYLLLGWGSCCGGKHYSTANVFEIKEGSLQKCNSIFNGESEIYTGANRNQKIELKYDPKLKILGYNSYNLNEDSNFYEDEKSHVQWVLKENGFEKVK